MATYIKVDYTGQLVAQAKADIQANRWRAYDSQENAQALAETTTIRLAVERSPTGQRSFWNGTSRPVVRREEPVAAGRAKQRSAAFAKADYFVARYGFTTGRDLDTRTRLRDPNSRAFLGPVGWCKDDTITVSNTVIVTFGGDNTGTGVESVLFDRLAYEQVYGAGQSTAVLKHDAFWYGERGSSITLSVTGYRGGAMQKSGFTWINPTADQVWDQFLQLTSTAVQTQQNSCIDGDFVSYLTINFLTGLVRFTQSPP